MVAGFTVGGHVGGPTQVGHFLNSFFLTASALASFNCFIRAQHDRSGSSHFLGHSLQSGSSIVNIQLEINIEVYYKLGEKFITWTITFRI